jgi:hypothetical protein
MPVDSSADEPEESAAPAPVADHRDTAIIEPILSDRLPELETELSAEVIETDPPPAPAEDEAVEIEQDLPPEVEDAEEIADSELAGPELAGPETVDPEPMSQPVEDDRPAVDPVSDGPVAAPQPLEEPASRIPPRPDPFPWGDRGSAIFSDSDELEQTLIVPRRDTGERFVLQFSTGESVTVFGSGLLGRNPTPQPTEYFDQLVSITDPGKSVSKTHLEFGQETGSFWVSDRFSGNGSTVREPESAARRLVAGKRYRIVRGTRVDIGEQFFVVS